MTNLIQKVHTEKTYITSVVHENLCNIKYLFFKYNTCFSDF